MYFMSDPQALHVRRNVIPGKLGVDLHLHRVHIPLVVIMLCVLVDGTVIAVEQETIAHDEDCVEDDQDQQQEIHIPQPILYVPKAEATAYDVEQTEAN